MAALPEPERDPDRLSFIDTGELDPLPGQLVGRLLLARSLLHANVTLSARLAPGDSTAAHLIVLDDPDDVPYAVERMGGHGFRIDPCTSAIAFTVRSSHSEEAIRALIVALTIVIRELYAIDPDDSGTTIARCRTRELGER
jgi:hypothetical protein